MLTTLPFPAVHDLANLDISAADFTLSHILMPVISPVKLWAAEKPPPTLSWSCPNTSFPPPLMEIPEENVFLSV